MGDSRTRQLQIPSSGKGIIKKQDRECSGSGFFKKGETVVTLRRHLVGRRKRGWWWGFRDFSKHSWRDGEAVKWTFHIRSQTWFIRCWGSNRGLFVCWVSILPAEHTAALFSVTISWSRASGSQDWLGTHSVAKDLECILILFPHARVLRLQACSTTQAFCDFFRHSKL